MSVNYRPIEEYVRTVVAMNEFTAILLSYFPDGDTQIREIIIRNLIARGMTSLQSIIQLWHLGHFQDCWILYRALIDRLFHLRALAERNEFELFEKWSFVEQYEALNRVHSDSMFREKANNENLIITEKDRRRYNDIKRENIEWSRPRAEHVAKNSFNMPFLYYYGYDYASKQVHPMATDGEEDYQRIVHHAYLKYDQRVVINNTILIQTMLLQEGLNASKYKWRAIVYNFIGQCRSSLDTGSEDHLNTLVTLISQGPEYDWYKNE